MADLADIRMGEILNRVRSLTRTETVLRTPCPEANTNWGGEMLDMRQDGPLCVGLQDKWPKICKIC